MAEVKTASHEKATAGRDAAGRRRGIRFFFCEVFFFAVEMKSICDQNRPPFYRGTTPLDVATPVANYNDILARMLTPLFSQIWLKIKVWRIS